MHFLRANNQWTGAGTISFLQWTWTNNESNNEYYSWFLVHQSKTKTFIDLKPVKPPKDSTSLYIDEISPHLIHDVRAKGHVVISVNVFPSYGSPTRKRPNQSLLYYFRFVNIIPDRVTFSCQTTATFHCSLFQSIYSFSVYFLSWEKVCYFSFRYVNGSAGFFISTTFFFRFHQNLPIFSNAFGFHTFFPRYAITIPLYISSCKRLSSISAAFINRRT